MYARQTDAVISGRSTTASSPLSNWNISLPTMSVSVPTDRSNSSRGSTTGGRISRKP